VHAEIDDLRIDTDAACYPDSEAPHRILDALLGLPRCRWDVLLSRCGTNGRGLADRLLSPGDAR